jgi:hypothetical protein
MNTDDVQTLARFLATDYPFNIKVSSGACPTCFKNGKIKTIKSTNDSSLDSPTSRQEAYRKRVALWRELFETGGLDPIQCINAYIPSSKISRQAPKFTHPLIIHTELGEPCKDKPDCAPLCLICNTPIDYHPSVTAAPWTHPVHKVCCDPCGYALPGASKGTVCRAPTLTVPKLFKDTLGITTRCAAHGNHVKVRMEAPVVEGTPKPAPPNDRAPVPAVKPKPPPTQSRPPPPRKLLKIERVKETGSHDIAKLLFPDRRTAKDRPEPKRARIEPPPTPSRGPGAAFLYGEKHFDFSEPKRLTPSDDPAHEKYENKARSSAPDGDDGGSRVLPDNGALH